MAEGELRLLGPVSGPGFARQLVAERTADDTSVWSDALLAQRRAESDDE